MQYSTPETVHTIAARAKATEDMRGKLVGAAQYAYALYKETSEIVGAELLALEFTEERVCYRVVLCFSFSDRIDLCRTESALIIRALHRHSEAHDYLIMDIIKDEMYGEGRSKAYLTLDIAPFRNEG